MLILIIFSKKKTFSNASELNKHLERISSPYTLEEFGYKRFQTELERTRLELCPCQPVVANEVIERCFCNHEAVELVAGDRNFFKCPTPHESGGCLFFKWRTEPSIYTNIMSSCQTSAYY